MSNPAEERQLGCRQGPVVVAPASDNLAKIPVDFLVVVDDENAPIDQR
jgi:hypothetical protein